MVVVDALVQVSELARGVADGAEHPSLLFVLDAEEELQCLFVVPFLTQVASGKIEVVIAQSRRVAVETSLDAAAPDLPGSTARFDAVPLFVAVSLASGAVLGRACFGVVLVELPHLLDRESAWHDQDEDDQHRQSRRENR
jgi:hypothetical protein